MPVYIERFLLPFLAGAAVAFGITNPGNLEPAPRFVTAAGIALMALAAAYLLHRYNKKIASAVPDAALTAPPAAKPRIQGREYVTVEPDYLRNFFANHTKVQAEQLLRPYKGHWLRIGGPVSDVGELADGTVMVSIHNQSKSAHLFFSAERKIRLAQLRRGDHIDVDGKIASADRYDVTLADCEIID